MTKAERLRKDVELALLADRNAVDELKALQADKARLDWLEANKKLIFCFEYTPLNEWRITMPLKLADEHPAIEQVGSGNTARDCIDAAMKGESK